MKEVSLSTNIMKEHGIGGVAPTLSDSIMGPGRSTVSVEHDGRLSDVIIDVAPLRDCKDRVIVFEIATKVGNWSRATEVNRNTGFEYWQNSAIYSCNDEVGVEDAERYLICSQIEHMQIQRMYQEAFE